jgi:hypothetical protein
MEFIYYLFMIQIYVLLGEHHLIVWKCHFMSPYYNTISEKLKLNSLDLVRELTIPAEWPPLAGEVSANFEDIRVPRGQRDIPMALFSDF